MSRPGQNYQKKFARRRRARGRGLAAVLAVAPAVAAAAPEAPPQAAIPRPARPLVWDAPPVCPTHGVVADWIDEFAAGGDASASIHADGRVTRDDETFVLHLTVEQPSGRRQLRLEHTQCEPLARAAALVVAVALDPVAVAARVPLQRPSAAAVSPPVVVAPPRDTTPAHVAAPSSAPRRSAPLRPPKPRRGPSGRGGDDLRALIRPEFIVGAGVLPPPLGFGLGGALGLMGRRWRVEGVGAYHTPRRATVGTSDVGGRVWLATGGARGCYVWSRGAVQLPVCGGVELGALGGRGFGEGIDVTRNTDLWVGLPLSLSLSWAPVPLLALVGRVEAVVGLRRPGFHLEGFDLVHRAGRLGARLAGGVEIRLPR